jgi:hypothetical protein
MAYAVAASFLYFAQKHVKAKGILCKSADFRERAKFYLTKYIIYDKIKTILMVSATDG